VEVAAVREVREETGVEIELGPLLGLYSRPGETVVLAAYACRNFHGDPAAGDDLDMIGWYAPDALPEMAFPHDTQIIEDWRAQRSRKSVPTAGGEGIS
jgi:ADP-ribose pyrophosphatase YjhB (NUDIX family)